jgi:hypothetical protein
MRLSLSPYPTAQSAQDRYWKLEVSGGTKLQQTSDIADNRAHRQSSNSPSMLGPSNGISSLLIDLQVFEGTSGIDVKKVPVSSAAATAIKLTHTRQKSSSRVTTSRSAFQKTCLAGYLTGPEGRSTKARRCWQRTTLTSTAVPSTHILEYVEERGEIPQEPNLTHLAGISRRNDRHRNLCHRRHELGGTRAENSHFFRCRSTSQ